MTAKYSNLDQYGLFYEKVQVTAGARLPFKIFGEVKVWVTERGKIYVEGTAEQLLESALLGFDVAAYVEMLKSNFDVSTKLTGLSSTEYVHSRRIEILKEYRIRVNLHTPYFSPIIEGQRCFPLMTAAQRIQILFSRYLIMQGAAFKYKLRVKKTSCKIPFVINSTELVLTTYWYRTFLKYKYYGYAAWDLIAKRICNGGVVYLDFWGNYALVAARQKGILRSAGLYFVHRIETKRCARGNKLQLCVVGNKKFRECVGWRDEVPSKYVKLL